MAIKKNPKTYQTDDGREFSSKANASKHEKLAAAWEAYKTARVRLGRIVAESQKTADGVAFDFSRWDYWYVSESWGGMPSLSKVAFYVHSVEFVFREDDANDELALLYSDRSDGRLTEYRIGDLYYHEHNAKVALAEAMRERIQMHADALAKLEKEISKAVS